MRTTSVNLNLWVTPDEANLNTSSGGLHVYDYKPELVNHEEFDNVNSMSNIEQNLRRCVAPGAFIELANFMSHRCQFHF